MYSKIKYILLLGLLIQLIACSNPTSEKTSNSKWISLALQTEKYIQHAQYTSEAGTSWKVMPDSSASHSDPSLYSGSPGIVLFYLELYHATEDTSYLHKAKLGADYLINTLSDKIPNANNVGLYTGLAGVGYTLTEVFKTTEKQIYKDATMRILELLEESAERSTSGIHWGGINDIVYGGAGIGLFLQYLSDELHLEKAESLSLLVAEGLLESAIDTLAGWRWKFTPTYSRYMDNFSHGTAGVGYFLSQTFQRTQEKKYLDAALKAAYLLDNFTNEEGYISHHAPGGEDLYYLSWCHGPPGTARFYYSLYESTKDKKWVDKIMFAANNLMEEGIDTTETPGYWNNVGKCCGATGVAEHYLWLYQLTGDQSYLEFSNKMTQSILAKGTQQEDHLKWIHAENRVSPQVQAAQTGLMQGSAGIGLWLLKLNAYTQDKPPRICLPDEPKALATSISQ